MDANDRLTNQQRNSIDQETDSGPPGASMGGALDNLDVRARDSSWHGQQSATAVQDKAQLDQATKFDGGDITGDTLGGKT